MGRLGLRQRKHARGRRLGCAVALLACGLPVSLAAAAPADAPRPAIRIPVEPLGFVPPGRFFQPYRIPSVTLDFLDSSHLLFTFHAARLMHREADDPKDDSDQTIRALVLAVPGGKVEAEGAWRMHDRDRYLWILGNGQFLVRQRNTLYISDARLALSVYLHPEGTFVSAQLSPDAGTLVAQFANPAKVIEEGDGSQSVAPTLGPSPGTSSSDDALTEFIEKRKVYTALVVNTRDRSAERISGLHQPLLFQMVEGGFLGVLPDRGKQWNVVLSSFGGKPTPIVNVTSTCQPMLAPLSEQIFLAQTCLPYLSDHLMQAYDLHGHKLWEQMWQSRFTWGTYAYAAAGNRFAYGAIEVNHNLAALDPVDESSILGQPVGIFTAATGKLDTVLDATPVLTAGDNFALSPEGNRLAILRNGAIEIYNLPPLASPAPAPATSASK